MASVELVSLTMANHFTIHFLCKWFTPQDSDKEQQSSVRYTKCYVFNNAQVRIYREWYKKLQKGICCCTVNIFINDSQTAKHKYPNNSSAQQQYAEEKLKHIFSNIEAAAVLHQQKNVPDFTPVSYCKNKRLKPEKLRTGRREEEKHFLLELISIILWQ